MNFWEDLKFVEVVKVIGRKKLIFVVFWIEVCFVFFVFEVIKVGYEVYVVDDVLGGISLIVYNVVMCRVE